MVIDQGNFSIEDFDLKSTNNWELILLWASDQIFFLNFVLKLLGTKKSDTFIFYVAS